MDKKLFECKENREKQGVWGVRNLLSLIFYLPPTIFVNLFCNKLFLRYNEPSNLISTMLLNSVIKVKFDGIVNSYNCLSTNIAVWQ